MSHSGGSYEKGAEKFFLTGFDGKETQNHAIHYFCVKFRNEKIIAIMNKTDAKNFDLSQKNRALA